MPRRRISWATQDSYLYENEPIWSRSEKTLTRTAFDAALGRELHEEIRTTKQMAKAIQQSADLWDLEDYLTQRRKEIDRKYDYRYSLTRSAPPAFKHTINVVANGVSGIHAAQSLHEKAIVFRMPVADGCHHRRS
jgi:hypothetical protein